MSKWFRHSALALAPLASVLLAASPGIAGPGPLNKDYGGNLSMTLYTPTTPAASPAILVAMHYCTGKASNATWFDAAAEKYGFYVIAPDAGKQCFDASATRAGDRADVVKMVQYVITQKKTDKNRVFAAGFSSGGCMVNTLLAIYPDVFAGGSALPGFPAGTWPAGDTVCTQCGNSMSMPPNKTPQQWGDMARTAFAFTGTRPCVQEWVGGGEEYSFKNYLPAVTAQFTNLMDLGAGTSGTGAPSGWTRTVYKDSAGNVRLETNLGPASQKHDLTGANLAGQVVSFLGLDKPTGACGLTTGGGGSGSGGASGGGGTTATGGASSGSGGTTAAGGSPTGSAGAGTTMGGAPTTAGAPGSAGATTSSGGAPGSAGSATSTSGAPGSAGAKHAAGAAGATSGDSDSGCSFSPVGTTSNHSNVAAMLGLTAMCIGAARRRKHAT
ncbi:MAG TPA: PHB depolymerase family esterase [Polyangiaceae bacterium]|nr:PHB depolymerase family esterase [Polyangiaceae bacterium]